MASVAKSGRPSNALRATCVLTTAPEEITGRAGQANSAASNQAAGQDSAPRSSAAVFQNTAALSARAIRSCAALSFLHRGDRYANLLAPTRRAYDATTRDRARAANAGSPVLIGLAPHKKLAEDVGLKPSPWFERPFPRYGGCRGW
jgi:hypothetical protein